MNVQQLIEALEKMDPKAMVLQPSLDAPGTLCPIMCIEKEGQGVVIS